MLRVEGQWREAGWEAALEAAAGLLRDAVREEGAARVGFLAAPGSTNEEAYLLGRLARGLGSHNVDSRLRQLDFSDQANDPAYSGLGVGVQAIESLGALLLAGCHVREEAPVLAHRVRKAALAGCKVSLLATETQDCHFPVLRQSVVPPADLASELAALATGGPLTDARRAVVDSLSAGNAAIVLGGVAFRHTHFADIRAAAAALAARTGATLGFLPDGGNAAGAALAGALPHRLPGGRPDHEAGLDVGRMLDAPLAACLLLGGIEPARDIGRPGAEQSLAACRRVIAVTPYADASVMKLAQVLLPMGTFAETSGSYVSAEGRWQEFRGCAQPVGEARPAWKILRVLANQLGLEPFDYESAADVLAELRGLAGGVAYDGRFASARAVPPDERRGSSTTVPIYAVDAIVRRAPALQRTRAAQRRNGRGG
jgi:NADH-quinone oxidoreductase subunit G